MRHGENPSQQPLPLQSLSRFCGPYFRSVIVAVISIALASLGYAIQTSDHARLEPVNIADTSTTEVPLASQEQRAPGFDISKYLPLLEELGRLQQKMQHEIQFPALRTQPKLLAQLPASTEIFFALPNYGDSLHQAVQIFQKELLENQTLREGWQSFPAGPIVEDGLDKVYQLSQYLGNEVVVAGEVKPKGGSFLIVAEIKKPGLSAFLQGLVKQFAPGPSSPIRILSPQQLVTAKATPSKQQALVLVRPDLVVITSEMSTLKSFNAQLIRPGGKLAPTPFGQRLAQAYQGGAGILFGADLEHLKGLVPVNTKKDAASFQQTGFADVKYLVAEHKATAGQTSNNVELSFNGPRHGVASWLAAPAPFGSLDFVSTDAALATSLAIKSPAQMFDDILAIAKISNPDVETGLAQGEAALNLKLREDLLNKIGKDITLSVDGPIASMDSIPPWKVVLQVKDSAGLQQTLKQLLASANIFMKGDQQPTLDQQTEAGQTYYTLRFFSGSKPTEVNYVFADGYMVLAANRDLLSEALRVHRQGNSLARSSGFHALRPQDHPGDASAMWYQNFGRLLIPIMQKTSPDLASLLQGAPPQTIASATYAYGEENAIHVASNGPEAVLAGALIGAAIAIPNLMRSKVAANEAGGAATMRMLIVTEITYSNSFPEQGYAPDLVTLGPGPDSECQPSKSHACLIDAVLGCASGTSGEWCTKGGYRYTITATCKAGVCDDFVVVGTPVNSSAANKSYCATSDAVVRAQSGAPLTSPISVSECQSWNPI
ncbi:MAG TPA: hypothetical protein VG649_24635 [Candidatus Angelobacter sp.]|jgi:hypothetical protein|nr:hypothetical protein [Candidatus Angelobacter sp.]